MTTDSSVKRQHQERVHDVDKRASPSPQQWSGSTDVAASSAASVVAVVAMASALYLCRRLLFLVLRWRITECRFRPMEEY